MKEWNWNLNLKRWTLSPMSFQDIVLMHHGNCPAVLSSVGSSLLGTHELCSMYSITKIATSLRPDCTQGSEISIRTSKANIQPKAHALQNRLSLIFLLLLPQYFMPTKLICFLWILMTLCSAFCHYYINKILFCQCYAML